MRGLLTVLILLCLSTTILGCNDSSPTVQLGPERIGEGLPEGSATDWPWWRGPNRDNIMPADQDPPTEWSETENILWRIDLPGTGHATPCMVGDRFLLPTSDKPAGKEAVGTISILCYNREDGSPLWETKVYKGNLPRMHKDNSHASATVAYDGKLAFFPYQTEDSVRLVAIDLEGKIAWDKEVGHCTMYHGFSGSPTLYGNVVIVATGSRVDPVIAAFERSTGEMAWKIDTPDPNESYASLMAVNVAGRDQLLLIGPVKTRSYDPKNGKPLWECEGPAEYNSATPVVSDDTVFSWGGYPKRSQLAVKADGSGAVDAIWRLDGSRPKMGYVPTNLYHEGLLYGVTDEGYMRCYDAATGEIYWEHDTEAPFYSSPVLVDDRLYVFDRDGKGYIYRTGKTLEVIAENELDAGVFATPVILDGRVYLRTLDDFYSIEKE